MNRSTKLICSLIEKSVREGGPDFFLIYFLRGGWMSHQNYFTGGRADLLREVIGPLASRGGSVPVFLRKHIGLYINKKNSA